MKMFFYLMLLSVPAHAMSDCEREVARIRMTPAKLISVAEWDKMLAGCPVKAAKTTVEEPLPAGFVLDDPRREDTIPVSENRSAEIQEALRESEAFTKLNQKLMAETDAEISKLRTRQHPSVSCTSFVLGNIVQTNCN